ncbi:MAG: hemolysin family protein [Planctomycetota bacterium]|nr:hemolysin family protein [Planctomycetota bacterium]
MDPVLELILAVGAAVVISSLCSLFEAVLYAIPRSHIENLDEQGRPTGRILKELREDIDRPIAAILSLNTVAHTIGAAVAGAAAALVFGHQNLLYFSAAFTLIILLVSEIIPKTVGVVFCRPLAPWVARPLQWLVWLLGPLVWLCRGVTWFISRGKMVEEVSEQEVIVMARLGQKSGNIRDDEAQVIENILVLESKTARDIMTPRSVIVALNLNISVEEARHQPGVLEHSRIPVFDKDTDDIVGFVHRRDILAEAAEDNADTTVEALMNPIEFATDATNLDILLRKAVDERQHIFIIIDEWGGMAGLVTLEDLLEEILGEEIVDEFDKVIDMRELAHLRRQKLLAQDGRNAGGES